MTDRPRAIVLVARIAAYYPSTDLTEENVEVYADELESLDLDVMEDVAHRVVRTHKWFPAVSELLDAYHREVRRRERAPALDEPEDPEIAREALAMMRRVLSGEWTVEDARRAVPERMREEER